MQERVIGAFTFPSKKAAEREIRRILHNSPLSQPLVGAESELIISLIGLHHEAETKIGPGVCSVEVRIIEYGSRGFWIVHTDGSSCDFSYRTALNGSADHKTMCRRAMRMAVKQQISEFRRQVFADQNEIQCPLTGQMISMGPWAHVDHIVEFATIADIFAGMVGGYQKIQIGSSMTHPGSALANPTQLDQWRTFHNHVARLRVVHSSANLARYKKTAA